MCMDLRQWCSAEVLTRGIKQGFSICNILEQRPAEMAKNLFNSLLDITLNLYPSVLKL